MRIKTQKYKEITLISVLALLILLHTIQYSFNNLFSIDKQFFSVETPKNAGYWDLTSPIVIIGNSEWSSKYSSEPWFSGSGSWSDPYVIENVTIDGNDTGSCISIWNSDVYFEIRNCSLYNAGFTSPDSAIILNNVINAAIIGNNLTDTNFRGLTIDNSHNNTFIGNNASDTDLGFLLRNSDFNLISGNTVNDCIENGINVDTNSNNNSIAGNTVIGCNSYGISIFDYSHNNTVSGNTVVDNNVGISMYVYCHENRIFDNIIEDNNIGVYIHNANSTKNTVYDNTFLLNTVNGRDDSLYVNYWNLGILGNYWDDYGGVDANDDGIGDSAYVVSGLRGRLDNYPIWDDGFDGSKIHIDDTGLNSFDWEWASKRTSWCTGSGTFDDPYTIKDIAIDAGNVGSCIFIESSSVYFVIKNCNLTNADASGSQAGIKFEDVYNGKIFENNCTDNYIGIRLLRSDNNSISSNYLYDNTGQGIILSQSEYNIIEGNIANNSNYYGLLINAQSNNNTIEGNTFGNNKGAVGYGSGIKISYSNDCEVSGNLLSDNEQGIRITDNSHGNKFYDNVIHNNAKYGVLIQDLTRNCNNSVFYNNSLINPLGINAYDNGSSSEWDNGTLGNFWSDYGGADNNGDGIGDTPYLISGDANSQDNYPIWDVSDDIYPTISINSPSGGSVFGTDAPTYSLNIFDLYLNTSWYTLNSSATRYFFTPSNGINVVAIDETGWDSFSDGSMLMTFYVNDSGGNTASVSNVITKDATNPVITVSPNNFTVEVGYTGQSISWTATDANPNTYTIELQGSGIVADSIAWTSGSAINYNIPDGFSPGVYTYSITFTDESGNSISNIVTVTIDSIGDDGTPGGGIPFGDYYILFIGIGIVTMLLVERKKRKK